MQRTYSSTEFFWNWSKLNTITSQALSFHWLYSPLLFLCSSRPLNWPLVVERDDCISSSQHLLRSIGQLASHLLSRILEWSWGVMGSVYLSLYVSVCISFYCRVEVYIEVNWFDQIWLPYFNCTWCIASLTWAAPLCALRFTKPSSQLPKVMCNCLEIVMLSIYLLICH
jgi:hypothetical protein